MSAAMEGFLPKIEARLRNNVFARMQNNLGAAMGVFLEWLETPGGLWQTAHQAPENRVEELIQSMKDIRDAVRDAPGSGGDILTVEFGQKLILVYDRLVALAESIGQPTMFSDDLLDQTFQPLRDGYYAWEILFQCKSYKVREEAKRLEDGRRRTAA